MKDKPAANLAMAIKKLAAYESRKYSTSVLFGTVTEIGDNNSVRIKLFNGFEIGGAQVVLSMFCTERTIHIPYDGSESDDEDLNSHVHDESDELAFTISGSNGGGPVMFTVVPVLDPTDPPPEEPPKPAESVTFKHKHKIKPALPTIKLWRGLVVGDIVVLSEMGNGQYFVHERAALAGGNSNEILNPKDSGMKGGAKEYE